jgi:predicted porin
VSVSKILVCVAASAGFAAAAQAADLDAGGMKDPLPDTLTWHGVTIYGTIDVGYAYQTNGRPLGSVISGLEFIPFTTTRNYTGQSVSTIAHSGLEQSKVGVKIEEEIGYGWTALGKLDTGFNPLNGELSNGCVSFLQNAAIPAAQQTSNADSGRCGQAFNGVAYAGVSNAAYGTLTFGRQASLQLDAIGAYDPMSLSFAFSLLGYSGTNAGSGSTQAARWDNSVKYLYQYGPVHAAVMYSSGGEDAGMFGNGYGFNVGGAYRGFSLDAVYTKEHGDVNLSTSFKDQFATQVLAANISDDETWSLMGKYTYEFGGGFKDEGPGAKLTFFAGYTHTDLSNPKDPVLSGTAAGGFPLAAPPTLLDNNAFTTDKILQFYWTGAKYELPSGWSFTGAYYHVDQNSYKADNKSCANVGLGPAGALQCAGSFDQGSFLVDYQFTKHFDVYAGVTYARVDDGLAAGFPGTPGTTNTCGPANNASCRASGSATSVDTTSFMTGMRLRF